MAIHSKVVVLGGAPDGSGLTLRLTGWEANFAVFLEGRRYYIDIAFPHIKLAIESDGRKHEEDHELVESRRLLELLRVIRSEDEDILANVDATL